MNALLGIGLIVTSTGLYWGAAVAIREDEHMGCSALVLLLFSWAVWEAWLEGARKDKKCLICVLVGIVMSAIGLVLEVWLRSVR